MKTLNGLMKARLRRVVTVLGAAACVLGVAASSPARPESAPTGRVAELPAGDVPGEIFVNPEVEAVYPINVPATFGDERGTGAGALHANLTTYLGSNFLNTGAAGTGAAAITRLIASEIFLTGPGQITRIKLSVANTLGSAVTARARPRFYNTGGPSGPGTLILGLTFNGVTFPASSVTVLVTDIPSTNFPGNCWAGVTFDAGGTGSALATLAELNALGQGLYSPATAGDINGQMFRSTSAGSFLGSNPAGSQSSQPGAGGWELRTQTGACCFELLPCAVLTGPDCLNQGGVFRGPATTCSVCATAVNFLHDPPQEGFYYALDQISATSLTGVQTRVSEQVNAMPPSNLNVAYIDEFELSAPRVIARIDTLVTSGVGEPLPASGGFLMSIWPSPGAAASDFTLQSNTIYNQGYTVPLVFRGGGEYDLVSLIGPSNPLNARGLATQIDPTIALNEMGPPSDGEPGDRGITPSGSNGLVLNAGQYYIAVMHRAPGVFTGGVLDSTAQDPRFPPNNAFRVNPGGGVFGGGIQQLNLPGAYRVMARNCEGDFTGDGLVGTQDLVLFLSAFGTFAGGYSPYDLNRDLFINVGDLVVLLARFGGPCR